MNSLALVTYLIVIVSFLVQNKFIKVWFFKKTFLLVDTSIKIVQKMLFLISGCGYAICKKNASIEKIYSWKDLLITKKVKLID